MRCIEVALRVAAAVAVAAAAGCGAPPTVEPAGELPVRAPAARTQDREDAAAEPRVVASGRTPPPRAARAALPPPDRPGSWAELRLQAARRLVAAHPDASYEGPSPQTLLAIPVLEIELARDGSVRSVSVLRHPRQATDTTQLAIDAVHRAAPYGNVSRLPRPWKFVETFLFDEQRRFKPRTLD